MNKLLLVILFLVTFPAWATEYWVDLSGAASGSGTSVSDLAPDLASVAEGAGDTVYLCNTGTTITFSTAGASDTSRITYNWTCPGGTPGKIDGGGTVNKCMTVTASNQYHVGPATITNCDEKGLFVDGTLSNLTFDDFETSYITGAEAYAEGDGTGAIIDNLEAPGTTSPVSNIVWNRLVSHHNGVSGFDTQTSGSGIVCNDCVAYSNGGLYAGGGFFVHPYRTTVTSGWTVVSGTVYTRNSASATDDVDSVYWVDGGIHLTEVSCGGTINSGEFCYNVGAPGVGYLRVNIGTDPAGDTIQYRRGPLTGVVFNNPIAYDNENGAGDHGSGIQVDDMNTGVIVNSPLVYNNAGPGIKVYRSEDVIINSPISFGNGTDSANTNGDRSGIHFDQSEGTVANNATSHGNGFYGIQQGTGNGTCNNCALTGNDSYGARAVTGTLTLNYSDVYANVAGATTTATGGTLNNNSGLAVDPLFIGGPSPTTVEGFRPSATSPLAGAGADLGDEFADYFGDTFYNGSWDIGAFRRDSCYRRSRDGKLDMARTRAQVVSRCLGVPGRYPEGL